MATQEITVISFHDGIAYIAVVYDDTDYRITGLHVVNNSSSPVYVSIAKKGRDIEGSIPPNTDRIITVLRNYKFEIGIDPDPELGEPSLNYGNCWASARWPEP